MSEGPIAQPNSSPIIVEGDEEVKEDSKVKIYIFAIIFYRKSQEIVWSQPRMRN